MKDTKIKKYFFYIILGLIIILFCWELYEYFNSEMFERLLENIAIGQEYIKIDKAAFY